MNNARGHIGALVALGASMFMPYAIAGPAMFKDDWFMLRNARFDGWWMSTPTSQWLARPVGSAIYALTFGLIGQRPTVHVALAATVVTATAIVVYRIAARFLPPLTALAVAGTWLVLPNHTSLEVWPSAFNIAVALLLLALAVDLMTHPSASDRRDRFATVLFVVGLLSYEAIGPAAVAAVLVIGWWRGPGRRLRTIVPPFLGLGVGAAWMIVNLHPAKEGQEPIDPSLVFPAHFGHTITGSVQVVEFGLAVIVLVLSAFTGWTLLHSDRRAGTGWEEWTVMTGWALIVLGALPFLRYYYAPIGFDDRVLLVSSIGGALVITGVVAALARWWQPSAVLVALALVATVVSQRASLVHDYTVAADDSRRIRTAVKERWRVPPDGEIVFGPALIVSRRIVAFEHVGPSLELLYDQPSVDARIASDPDDFYSTPTELRFDLRRYSNLDDGRLGDPL